MSNPATEATAHGRPPLKRWHYFVYGVSGIAIGTINTGLNFFLLLYYDQVVGLQPFLAGLALAIALVFDGITDPLVGLISDRWRSKLGRRHPFLYVSVLPLALSYAAIWFPPFGADNQIGLFFYLLATSLCLRIALTLFDVPGNALVPEITRDYESRTRLSAFKVSFTWVTSNITGILMYAIWLRDDGTAGSGLLDQAGYQHGGVVFAIAAFFAALMVPVGLHSWTRYLRSSGDEKHPPMRLALRNMKETYSNASILALLGSAVFLASASGLTNALWVYLYSFYWGCTSAQVNVIQFTYLFAAIAALLWLPRLSVGRDKRRLTLQVATWFWIFTASPYALNSVGWMPAAESELRMWALGTHALIDGILFNMLMALMFSLLADIVEDSLLRTGRREEALILASQTFVTKTSTAAGTWFAALVLTTVAFPRGKSAAAIAPGTLHDLGITYILLMWIAGAISIVFLTRYRITREKYLENAHALARAESRA